MRQLFGDYSKRPFQYYNIDGVGELGIGFMLLGFGLLMWLQLHSPEHSFWHRQYTLFLFVAAMSAIIHYGSKAIKQRITYPRTGYVEYRKIDTVGRPMILGTLTSGLMSAALIVLLRLHWDVKTLSSLFIGLLFGVTYARGFARTVRWKWAVVAAIAICSLTLAILPTDTIQSVVLHSGLPGNTLPAVAAVFLIWFLFYGSVLLASGGLSFYIYLRQTQSPSEDAQ
jgi:hypothetical protein